MEERWTRTRREIQLSTELGEKYNSHFDGPELGEKYNSQELGEKYNSHFDGPELGEKYNSRIDGPELGEKFNSHIGNEGSHLALRGPILALENCDSRTN